MYVIHFEMRKNIVGYNVCRVNATDVSNKAEIESHKFITMLVQMNNLNNTTIWNFTQSLVF